MNNLLTHILSMLSLTLRGSKVASRLTVSFVMQPLCYFACTFLFRLSVLSSVLSTQCNETQYPWPVEKPKLCCNKCPPGKHLLRRFGECQTQCEPCVGKRYRDTYNVELFCDFCENCNRSNMDYKSHCNSSHNAECSCKAGFECKEQPCKLCVPIPTTKPTLPPFMSDSPAVWSLVMIGLLSAGIACILVTKIKPFLQWIRSKHGYHLAETCAPVAPCSGDEVVSKPVQEAGNVTNLKEDPELGLSAFSHVDM